MTIRFIRQWNGYDDMDSASLPGAEEARLVGLGLAKYSDNNASWTSGEFKQLKNTKIFSKPWGAPEVNSGVLGYTLALRLKVPFPFYAVRVHNYNANAVAVTASKIAVSPSTTGGYSNTPGGASWVPVTFNGASSFSETAATASGQRWGVTVSDIIPVKCKARTDGGSGYILDLYKFNTSAGNANTTRIGTISDLAEGFENQGCCVGAFSGDAVATPGSFVRSLTGLGPACAVEFYTIGNKSKSLMTIGDSLLQGQGGESAADGAARRACRDLGLMWVNHADSGRISPDYIYNAVDKINTIKPSYVYFAPYGVNDTGAVVAGYDQTMMYNLSVVLDACLQAGSVPIVATPQPKPGLNAGQEAIRRDCVNQLKTACDNAGIAYVDKDALFTDYSVVTGGYKAGMTTDTVHQNDGSYQIETDELKRVLATIL